MSDPARMKTDEPVFMTLEAALYNSPLWKQGTVIFDGYAGQFQEEQDQIGHVYSTEITDADNNTLTGLDAKRSLYRKANPYWNALNDFNPPALTRDQQERIANQRYESSSGTIYTQDQILALYSNPDTKEFWDTSGGPTHLQKRIRDTLDETERYEAMFQHGTIAGYGSAILSGMLDPVGIGTWLLTRSRLPGYRQALEARKALKNIRALEKSVKAGKSLSTAQSVSLTRWDKIAKAFPSTAKRLGYAVGTNASEATLSLWFESFVDEQLDVDDYVSAVGAAGVFTTAIMGLGAGGARAMQQASKVYQKAIDNHLVKQIGRVEKQSAPGRSLPTPQEREDLVSMALDIAKTNEEPFKVAYERLLKMSGKIHDFAVRAKSFNQLKDRPSDLIYDDNPFVRGLSNILFRQNVLLDADDFDPRIAISDFLAHHRQVVDNQKYVTSETAREFISPDTPNGDQEWLDAVIELLDEAPVEKVDEQGVSRMVDRLDADNSPYLEKSEAWKEAARKEAETIRNTIFVYEGEELGLAERKAFYFPHGNRVKEYLTDEDKVEQFEKNVEEYLRDEIGITDPDEIKKFTDRAISSIQRSGPGSEVSLGFTIDDSGRIGNEFLAQSEVSTPGQTKERTINLPFRVMRPFYQEDSHLVLDTAMSRNNVVMATQELLKLNPKGHLDLLPKPKPEFKAPEDGSEPVEVPDYRDDWNSDTVKMKARESWSNPEEAAESLDRVLRTTKSTEEAYVNARTAKADHNTVIKENRQQIRDKKAQIKEEFGEEVAGRTEALNNLLDEEDLFTEELENLLEIQLEGEQGLESIGNQLRKFSDRVTRNLATESRKMKALKESKGVRAVRRDEADKLYNEAESIVVKMDDALVKKSEKQTKKLEANIETQKRGIVRSTEMLRLLRHFNGDKSEGLTTQQINEMVQFVSEEYSQPERFIRDFLKKKPESHIKKYERELARSNDKLSKAEEALKEWDDTGRKSSFTDKEQAKYDAAAKNMETYGEILSQPSEDAQKVWNSKVANALSIKVKDLRGQASLFNADNPLDISPELAEVLAKRGFRVRLGNAYFTGQDLVDEIARRQTALSENSNKILDVEDSIRSLESQVAEQAEGIRRFIQDIPEPAPVAKGRKLTDSEKSQLRDINKKIFEIAKKGRLTRGEADELQRLGKQSDSIQFLRGSTASVSKVGAAEETMSTLSADVVVAIHKDLYKNEGVFSAIRSAARGVAYDAETAIDATLRGSNPDASAQDLHEAFAPTRAALREQYGDTITVYRAEGVQIDKPTKNWATTREFAQQFGDNIVEKEIPIDSIVAANVTPNGKYHELIVAKDEFIPTTTIETSAPVTPVAQLPANQQLMETVQSKDEFIALVNQLESNLTQRETLKDLAAEAREVFKESRKVFRQATGSSYRTKSVSDKQYNSRVADIRHDHVMNTLSMGISSNGGKYELTEKGWAGEIKAWYEQKMIENPEQADALQASMDKAAYILGRFRDNTLGLEYRHIDDGGFGEKAWLNVSRVGSMARTFFTISKNTLQDASIAMAAGVEGAKLSKVFLRGLEKHLPGEDLKNIDKDVMGKMHRAAELAGLNRQGASSNRAYQLGDEGAQASKEIRGDSASDKVTTGFGKVWQTGSGFKYVQPYLRDTFSILYTDMILGFGERINMGKKLHPEDVDQLRRAGLTPEDAESIYADWAITQQAEDLVDVETGLKVVADLDVFTPKNREGLQQAVFNMVERIHLKPRFEDKYIMTGKDPGEAVKTERLMLALQGFSQTSHNVWFQGGLQSAMKHKRLGAYTERVLGSAALAVAITAGYRELTKAAEPEGAARPYDEDMTLGSYFLYTVNKSGVFGELSGLYDAARYSTAAKLIRDGAPEGGFETTKAIKGALVDVTSSLYPGISGAIDIGVDAGVAGYVAGVQPLVADKPTKKEVYKELGGLIKNGPFRGLLFIADLMEFGGWLKKRQEIKTRKQTIEVRKEQR